MQAGKLNKRVVIQKPVETQDSFGATITTWQSLGEVWASIQPLSAREAFNIRQVFAEVTHKVIIRYLAGVTPKCQIKYGSRTFDIEGVTSPNENGMSMELTCRELV